jgi:signal transduction histidine kinase
VSVLKNDTKRDNDYINTLNRLASEQFYFNIDTVYILANEAVELSIKKKYKKGEAEGLLNLGVYYTEKNKTELALKNLEKAKHLAELIQDTTILIEVYNNVGIEYSFHDKYAAATHTYLNGIKIAEKYNDGNMLALLLGNLAGLYADQDDLEMAIELDERALAIIEQENKDSKLITPLYNLAYSYTSIADYETANIHLNRLLEILDRHEQLDWTISAYTIKGTIFNDQKDYNQALVWFRKAEELFSKVDDRRSELTLLNKIAFASLKLDSIDIAHSYGLRALNLAKEIEETSEIIESANILYQVEEAKGNFKKALEYHQIFKEHQDSLAVKLNDKELTILKANLDFATQKERIAKENEISLAKQRNLIYFVISLLLIALLAVYFYSKNSKRQKRLNNELEASKKALELNEKRLNEANNVKDQLFSIVGHDLKSPIISINQLMDVCLEDDNGETLFKQFAPKLKNSLVYFQFTLDNLLHWGNSQLKGENINIQKVFLKDEIDSLSDFFELISREKSIDLINTIEADKIAFADLDHFRVIFRNLISNAIKFTPQKGKIEITAIQNEEKALTISVNDSGKGMDNDAINKIMSDDQHYSTYGTEGEKGTGLGLLLCKDLIVKNKGTLRIESELGKGSSFIVELSSENGHLA